MKQLTETYKVYRELPLFKVSTILSRGIDTCDHVLEPAGQSGGAEWLYPPGDDAPAGGEVRRGGGSCGEGDLGQVHHLLGPRHGIQLATRILNSFQQLQSLNV